MKLFVVMAASGLICVAGGCGPEQDDPLKDSRDSWKSQQQEHRDAIRDAQRQQAELMRDLGVGGH